jgi:hypothetical protein
MGRLGERHEVDVPIELLVDGEKRRFWKKEQALEIRIRNISVSGALLVVPAGAGLRVGQRVILRQEPRSIPMRIVRIETCLDPAYVLAGIDAPPNDRAWGEFVSTMIEGPGAPAGRRWLNGVG